MPQRSSNPIVVTLWMVCCATVLAYLWWRGPITQWPMQRSPTTPLGSSPVMALSAVLMALCVTCHGLWRRPSLGAPTAPLAGHPANWLGAFAGLSAVDAVWPSAMGHMTLQAVLAGAALTLLPIWAPTAAPSLKTRRLASITVALGLAACVPALPALGGDIRGLLALQALPLLAALISKATGGLAAQGSIGHAPFAALAAYSLSRLAEWAVGAAGLYLEPRHALLIGLCFTVWQLRQPDRSSSAPAPRPSSFIPATVPGELG